MGYTYKYKGRYGSTYTVDGRTNNVTRVQRAKPTPSSRPTKKVSAGDVAWKTFTKARSAYYTGKSVARVATTPYRWGKKVGRWLKK